MNVLRRYTAALAVAAVLLAPAAQADNVLDFELENRTGYAIKAVYADGAGSPVWYDLDPTTFSRLTLKRDKAKNKAVGQKHRQ